MSAERGGNDVLLSEFAAALEAQGVRLAGLVQDNVECGGSDAPCDMLTRVLPDGPIYQISQSLGPEARGCRLDPEALEQAVGQVQSSLETGQPDLLIANKFGKHEAAGRGMRPLIADALSRDIPVIMGVNKLNLDAFQEFCDNDATLIEAALDPLLNWFSGLGSARAQSRAAG